MEFIISFFRDTLDGTNYVIWLIVIGILIMSCIGYLAERHFAKKEKEAMYAKANIDDNTNNKENLVQEVKQAELPVQPPVQPAVVETKVEVAQPEVISTPVEEVKQAEITPEVKAVEEPVIPTVTQ